MARLIPLGKPGSTSLRKLPVLPLNPGAHNGSLDETVDSTWLTLQQDGGYAFTVGTPPPAGTISVPDLSLIACYTPLTNSGPAIAAHSFDIVTFDSASTGFPFRPGDVILGGKMANFSPKSTEAFAAEPLEDFGNGANFFVVSCSVSGHFSMGDPPTLNALVYNATAGSMTVPATWLPPIYILRLGA